MSEEADILLGAARKVRTDQWGFAWLARGFKTEPALLGKDFDHDIVILCQPPKRFQAAAAKPRNCDFVASENQREKCQLGACPVNIRINFESCEEREKQRGIEAARKKHFESI